MDSWSNRVLSVSTGERPMRTSTGRKRYYTELRVSSQGAGVESQPSRVPTTPTGKRSVGASTDRDWRVPTGWLDPPGVQQSYSGEGKACLYAPGWIGSVKFNFLIDTGCTHNLMSETIFDRLPAATRDRLEPWDTIVTLTDASGLPVYGKVVLKAEYGTPLFPWSSL